MYISELILHFILVCLFVDFADDFIEFFMGVVLVLLELKTQGADGVAQVFVLLEKMVDLTL